MGLAKDKNKQMKCKHDTRSKVRPNLGLPCKNNYVTGASGNLGTYLAGQLLACETSVAYST